MKFHMMLPFVSACVFLVACGEPRQDVSVGSVAMVEPTEQRNMDIAPSLPMVTRSGQMTELRQATEAIRVIAFVDSQGDCSFVHDGLRSLARDLSMDDVSVVQISEGCASCQRLMETARVQQANLMVLCDGQQTAWEAFLAPPMGTVFLVNADNRIVYESTDEDLPRIRREARRISQEYQSEMQQTWQTSATTPEPRSWSPKRPRVYRPDIRGPQFRGGY